METEPIVVRNNIERAKKNNNNNLFLTEECKQDQDVHLVLVDIHGVSSERYFNLVQDIDDC